MKLTNTYDQLSAAKEAGLPAVAIMLSGFMGTGKMNKVVQLGLKWCMLETAAQAALSD